MAVTLASTNPTVAPVPTSVTVPAGSTSTTFHITTASVLDDTSVSLTGTYRGTATGVLAVTAIPVTVSSVSVNPPNVVGGRVNSTGTVTLNRITGANGAVVNLASSNTSLATVPTTITIPPGANNGAFTVTTSTASAATPVTISATYGTTQSATLTVASCNDWTAGSATLGSETVWFDDAVPPGASTTGTWTWDTAKQASGTQSHVTLTTGTDTHKFDNDPNYFHFNVGDQVVQYVLTDPCNPPAEIMLEFGMCCDGWMHRAFWGQDLLNNSNYGMLGEDRIYMGPIPTGGQWLKLTAPASQLSMSGSGRGDVYGAQFDVVGGGHVWFDRTGKQSCTVAANIAPPSLPPTDVVWFDDAAPTGASLASWTWDTTQAASGTKAHHDPSNMDFHNHYFQGATQTMTPAVGDSLFTYALIDPCDPPNQVIVYWNDGTSWNHIAYWGVKAWNCGSEGPACHSMGPLPSTGGWVRLSVPASAVGLEGHTLNGMAFAAWNGHVWFDRAGIQPAGTGALQHHSTPAVLAADRGTQPRSLLQRLLARWRREPSALGFGVSAKFTAAPDMVGSTRQYSFYTPELHLLAETALTDAATPAVTNDYVWFSGEPLAQLSSTGDVAYDFNDHLGAPLLQTNPAGAVVWRAEREPYGNRYAVRAGGDRHQPLGLPGQEVSENSPELQFNIFRWYRSSWGRYVQPDRKGLDALRLGEKFGISVNHLFGYVDENPVTRIDPYGADWLNWIPDWVPNSGKLKCWVWGGRCNQEAQCCKQRFNIGQAFRRGACNARNELRSCGSHLGHLFSARTRLQEVLEVLSERSDGRSQAERTEGAGVLMLRIIVTLLVAGLAGVAALLMSFDIKGSPLQAETEMASRVAARDPLAQNSYYASAVFDSAQWFAATVLPAVAGFAGGLTALAVGLSIRRRLIVCAVAAIVLLVMLSSTPGRGILAVAMFSLALLGAASLRELRPQVVSVNEPLAERT